MMPTDAEAEERSIVLFDGVCDLCNRWVLFLSARDRGGRFVFGSLQSAAARPLLARYAVPDDLGTLVVIERGVCHLRSSAVLRALAGLGGAWRLARVLEYIPRAARDAAYDFVARHRYRWFGRRDRCPLPGSLPARPRFLG